jgi:hypothetical protein
LIDALGYEVIFSAREFLANFNFTAGILCGTPAEGVSES